jgi:hypothetical protein
MAPSLTEEAPQVFATAEKSKLNETVCGDGLLCHVTGAHEASLTATQTLTARNPSLQVTKDHRIKMEEAPILRPGPRDVLLHIKATGICG